LPSILMVARQATSARYSLGTNSRLFERAQVHRTKKGLLILLILVVAKKKNTCIWYSSSSSPAAKKRWSSEYIGSTFKWHSEGQIFEVLICVEHDWASVLVLLITCGQTTVLLILGIIVNYIQGWIRKTHVHILHSPSPAAKTNRVLSTSSGLAYCFTEEVVWVASTGWTA
jgi:hypothetical protein